MCSAGLQEGSAPETAHVRDIGNGQQTRVRERVGAATSCLIADGQAAREINTGALREAADAGEADRGHGGHGQIATGKVVAADRIRLSLGVANIKSSERSSAAGLGEGADATPIADGDGAGGRKDTRAEGVGAGCAAPGTDLNVTGDGVSAA